MKTDSYMILNNDVKIPCIGLGTWLIDNDVVNEAVKSALSLGYRHIDTAQAYGNEEGVGKGIKESGVPRENIFITSKIAAELKTYEEARSSIDESLKKMGLEYLDLMIIHAPEPWAVYHGENHYFKENIEVWRALEDAYNEKKIRAIGVSNFLQEDLDNILNNCRIKPMVNQILAHVANTPFDLIKYCNEKGITVEAYSPIAHGELLHNKILLDMAEKYNTSVSALCIKYVLELGLVALPKTSNVEHMKDNLRLDYELSTEDLEILKNMEHIKDYGEHSYFPVFSGK